MESVDSRTPHSLRTTPCSSFKIAAAARRRRVEIRRFRLIANSHPVSGFMEPVPKKMGQNGWHRTTDGKSTGSVELDTLSSSGQLSDIGSSSSLGSETGSTITDEIVNPGKQEIECHEGEQHTTEQSMSLDCDAGDSCPPHGAVFICGRRREMEDAVAVVPSFMTVPCGTIGGCDCRQGRSKTSEPRMSALHFFAVYDGHGGSQVASFCKEHLHRALEEEFDRLLHSTPPDQLALELNKALVASFLKIDAQVGGFWHCQAGTSSPTSSPNFVAPETVGSTAVVAVVGANRIFVANCGDSRAVLSRGGRAIPLSRDHKPNDTEELARVEAAGGRVIFWNGYRVLGVLAMSRAIGDRYLKPFIIPEPEVTCTERSEEDECLILASDGLWDVISNDMACEIARKCLSGKHRFHSTSDDREESAVDVAASLLTKVAIAKGSTDNISVVVVDLRSKNR